MCGSAATSRWGRSLRPAGLTVPPIAFADGSWLPELVEEKTTAVQLLRAWHEVTFRA